MNPFDFIENVGTPTALVAFVVAIAAYVYRLRLENQRRLIEGAEDETRADLVRSALEDFPNVTIDDLSEEKRFALVQQIIRERAARFRRIANLAVILAVLLTIVIVVVTVFFQPPGEQTARLVVRVQDPQGGIIMEGSVTIDVGTRRDTQRVDDQGQATFEGLPAQLPETGLAVQANVGGYLRAEQRLAQLPEGNVLSITLVAEEYETVVFGTVFSASTQQPMPGVRLFLDEATDALVTDENGSFRITLPKRPGDSVFVRALLDGHRGYQGEQTAQESGGWAIFFREGSST